MEISTKVSSSYRRLNSFYTRHPSNSLKPEISLRPIRPIQIKSCLPTHGRTDWQTLLKKTIRSNFFHLGGTANVDIGR